MEMPSKQGVRGNFLVLAETTFRRNALSFIRLRKGTKGVCTHCLGAKPYGWILED